MILKTLLDLVLCHYLGVFFSGSLLNYCPTLHLSNSGNMMWQHLTFTNVFFPPLGIQLVIVAAIADDDDDGDIL